MEDRDSIKTLENYKIPKSNSYSPKTEKEEVRDNLSDPRNETIKAYRKMQEMIEKIINIK